VNNLLSLLDTNDFQVKVKESKTFMKMRLFFSIFWVLVLLIESRAAVKNNYKIISMAFFLYINCMIFEGKKYKKRKIPLQK
jgi:hypothetical protein